MHILCVDFDEGEDGPAGGAYGVHPDHIGGLKGRGGKAGKRGKRWEGEERNGERYPHPFRFYGYAQALAHQRSVCKL